MTDLAHAHDVELVGDPDAVTPAWMTAVLRAAGALGDGGSVTAIDATPVGTGQVGDSIRFRLTYDGDAGPATVVGKFPAADEVSRASSVATRTYEIESRFYQQLRHRVGITTPEPYLVLLDVEANDFVLLMADLAPAEQGDQIVGCSADHAALALAEVAKLHAPVWGDPSLAGLDWLDRASDDGRAFYLQLLTGMWAGFSERYGDRVDAEVQAVGGELVARLAEYLEPGDHVLTAAHGDYRVDNMLFATPAGGAPLTTVDWQTVARSPGVTDVSYFLGTSVTSDVRASVERELVADYHAALVAGGVDGYSADACWTDYRRFAFQGFLMAVGASMLVGQTDRGDEMFMAMANRSGRMAIELEALSLL